MIEGKDREDTIARTAAALGIPLEEADLMYAIEHGEIPETGDVRQEGDMDDDDEPLATSDETP